MHEIIVEVELFSEELFQAMVEKNAKSPNNTAIVTTDTFNARCHR